MVFFMVLLVYTNYGTIGTIIYIGNMAFLKWAHIFYTFLILAPKSIFRLSG